jgi:hypothetical protein
MASCPARWSGPHHPRGLGRLWPVMRFAGAGGVGWRTARGTGYPVRRRNGRTMGRRRAGAGAGSAGESQRGYHHDQQDGDKYHRPQPDGGPARRPCGSATVPPRPATANPGVVEQVPGPWPRYQLFRAGEFLVPGQPGKDRESGSQARLTFPKCVFDPAEDALLASGQAHLATPVCPALSPRDRGRALWPRPPSASHSGKARGSLRRPCWEPT